MAFKSFVFVIIDHKPIICCGQYSVIECAVPIVVGFELFDEFSVAVKNIYDNGFIGFDFPEIIKTIVVWSEKSWILPNSYNF